jgi:predicted PurR-regulated permease PerM
MPNKIEISHKTIIFTVVFLVLIYFLYFIRDILLHFFMALLLMAILNPFVTKLAKYRIPRPVSILMVYVVVLGLISLALVSIITPLGEQSTNLVNSLPSYVQTITDSGEYGERLITELSSELSKLPGQIARLTISLFSNIFEILAILIFAFYLLLSRERLDDNLSILFGSHKKKEIERIVDLLESRLGGWVRGQVSLMFLVGLFTYILLTLLGIPFALPLALLAGLLEIVPYVGPIFSAIPAVIIGLGTSPFMGIATVAVYFLVQQVENYIFTPKIMERSAGVSPVVTLLALGVGFKVAGIAGVIISVPVVIILKVLIKEYLTREKSKILPIE